MLMNTNNRHSTLINSRIMKVIGLSFIILHLSLSPVRAQSGCNIENTAFRSGEFLAYDLYFNWQFVWMKVGTASMSTVMSVYNGIPAYRTNLTTGGNSRLENLFVLRDTLTTYCNIDDLSPLYYRKGAREGKRYYIDELWYSYPANKCKVKTHHVSSKGKHTYGEHEFSDCVYDMLSIFLCARNFDATKMKVGDVTPMPIMGSEELSDSWIVYRGKEKFKIDGTNEKFRCLVFSFMEREKGKTHELIRFYVTDDANHLPVRLDMNLSFGSAKAYLRTYRGVRSPLTSKVK